MDRDQSPKIAPLVITRTFDAPRDRVFAAFATFESMREWMCPPGFTVTDGHCDARPGGTFRLVMRYPQGDNSQWSHANEFGYTDAHGTFTDVTSPECLRYTIKHPGDVSDEFVSAKLSARSSDQTEVVFSHEGFASERSRAEYACGWDGAFAKLADMLRS